MLYFILNKLITRNFNGGSDNLLEDVKGSFDADKEIYRNEIFNLDKSIGEHSIQIEKANKELRVLLKLNF